MTDKANAGMLRCAQHGNRVRNFALTGGIGCGKSTVAGIFEELGAFIIDADNIGHEFLLPSSPVSQEVIGAFGPEILASNGRIDRRRLGAVVFSDPGALRRLNAILHPPILKRADQLAAERRKAQPECVIIVEAALIYEAGLEDRFAKVIVVWCTPDQQIERLRARMGLPRIDAERRITSQIPADEKRRRADFLIDCSGSLEETRRQAEALYLQLQQLAAKL